MSADDDEGLISPRAIFNQRRDDNDAISLKPARDSMRGLAPRPRIEVSNAFSRRGKGRRCKRSLIIV